MGEMEGTVGGDWNRRIDYDFKARNLTANGASCSS